jgi:hypothetical protein
MAASSGGRAATSVADAMSYEYRFQVATRLYRVLPYVWKAFIAMSSPAPGFAPASERGSRRRGVHVEKASSPTFSGLPGILLRRWYLTLVGLLVTVGLCFLATVLVPPTYSAKSNILLVPPPSASQNGNNPYLSLSGLTLAADVVQRAMSGTEAAQTLQARGVTGKYSTVRDLTTSGPVLLVTATGNTPAIALDSLNKVVALVAPTARSVQQAISVPSSAQFQTYVITKDDRTSTVRKTEIRALVVAAAAGIFLTLIAVAVLDSLLVRGSRRRALRRERAQQAEVAAAADPGDAAGAGSPRSPRSNETPALAEPGRDRLTDPAAVRDKRQPSGQDKALTGSARASGGAPRPGND